MLIRRFEKSSLPPSASMECSLGTVMPVESTIWTSVIGTWLQTSTLRISTVIGTWLTCRLQLS